MLQKIVIIVSTLFVLNALGQKAEVTLSVDPLSVEVGGVFTLTVKSSVQGEVEIDNLPSSFVYGYDVMNGMEQEMDYNTGNVITYYFLSQTGAIGKPGKFSIGPAYIKKGNKTYKSNKVTISVGNKTQMSSGDITKQQLNDPAFGIIQTKKSTIYEGEPVLVTARVYSKFEPTYLDGYLKYELKGSIDKHVIANSNKIIVKMEQFKGEEYYAFEYDKNLILRNHYLRDQTGDALDGKPRFSQPASAMHAAVAAAIPTSYLEPDPCSPGQPQLQLSQELAKDNTGRLATTTGYQRVLSRCCQIEGMAKPVRVERITEG